MQYIVNFLSKTIKISLLILSFFAIYGCGSDSEIEEETPVIVQPEPDPQPDPEPVEITITGSAVKGPLAFADVKVYAIDSTQTNFVGVTVGTGNTDASSQIENLSLPFPLSPPYILEISSVEDTIDITTGQYPVIEVMKTLLTVEMLSGGKQIFATPLTDMTVSLIFKNADSNVLPYTGNLDGTTTNEEILAAIASAQEQVKSTLGFGLEDDVDLFNTPPLINEDTNSTDEQASTAAYRSAVEALTAVVYEIKQLSGDSDISTDNILDDLAADLSDGVIDGTVDGVATESYPENALEILEQDPATLPIPNDPDGRTVADVKKLIIAETLQTGNSETDTTAFLASEEVIILAPAERSPDIDGDGIFNSLDAYPEDAAADSDFDHDGMPDVAYKVVDGLRTAVVDVERSDSDDDNDGVIDENDAFPFDVTETTDTDLDGTGNNADTDDDNDSILDTVDDFPLDSTRSNAVDQDNDGWPVGQDPNDSDVNIPGITFIDTDNDGQADTGGLAADNDDDNDGVFDIDDVFPLDASESSDLDFDAIGDNADTDIDGDNVLNIDDLFPYDAMESIDTDGDGIGNYRDEDDDGDSLKDETEALLGTDSLKSDTDGDGVFDNVDALPLDVNERFDTDKDTVGNNADNCPLIVNTFQINTDTDAFGNACDTDDDNDGVLDTEDDFPLDATKFNAVDSDNDGWPTEQDSDDENATVPSETFVDTDSDGLADRGGLTPDEDDDNDGIEDIYDAFPLNANEWLDTDSDGTGNNTDTDDDGDGYTDFDEVIAETNPLIKTSIPVDLDGDFISDATDIDKDGDNVNNLNDAFPSDASETTDTDGDGTGDYADVFPSDASEAIDTDGDGTGDNADVFPSDASEIIDTDGDGTGDNADVFPSDASEITDTDGDGTGDNADIFPSDATESLDTDEDGTGNNTDLDDDNDGFSDADEILVGTDPLLNSSVPADMDNDFIPDSLDDDRDGDGVDNDSDLYPDDPAESANSDGDTIADNADNCPAVTNEDQLDINGNGKGDVCESELFEFSYTFLTGEVLSGVINGVVLADTDTIEINSFISAKFDNKNFLSIESDEVRATLITNTPKMSLSGNVLDFWVCPAGFTSEYLDGGDCNFRNESGFLLTHSIEFAQNGWAGAGPGDGNTKPFEVGLTIANWTLSPLDTDDDSVLDIVDNCPLVPNTNQIDSDADGVGDVCDNYTFDLNGRWLIEQTFTQSGVGGQCQAAPVEADIVIATMNESQLHFVGHEDAAVEGEGISGIIKSDGTFTFNDGTFIVDDGVYDVNTDFLTFSFSEFDSRDNCTEVGHIYATRITDANEQASMVGGVSWYEGESNDNNGQISGVFFEKGDISEGLAEVFYKYDSQLGQWVISNDSSSSQLVTASGIAVNTDALTASGYVNAGETLILSDSNETLYLDFEEMSLDNYSIRGILDDEYSSVVPSDARFTSSAKAFFTTVTQQTDYYEFWCDDNWDNWFAENLTCDNAIPIAWEPGFTPAETMADIIGLSSNPLTDLIGGIWLGDTGQKSVQAYLVSDNGDIDGANFRVVIIENMYGGGESKKIAEAELIIKNVGSNIVYSFTVPENVHVDLGRNSDERHIFLVEDSETEPSLTIVRRGNYLPIGHTDSSLLFGTTAKAEIEAAFNYVDTDSDNIPDSLDPDQDNDGVANDDDVFPLDATEWSDLDGDGTGDNTDADRDGDGVDNDLDLAPDDADISVAQTFTNVELKAQYITLPLSHGDEPSFRLGVGAGTQYMFNAGLGDMISGSGSTSFSYSIVNDELLMSVDAPVQSTTYLTPSDMADMGIVSQQAADDFINSNGNYQIEMLSTVNERRWLLAASDISTQTFWQTSVTDYSFVQAWEQEQLIGSGSNLVTIEDSDSLLLTDISTLNATAFTEIELIAGNWAMPSNLDEFSTDIQFRLAADMATLNADYSGSNTISGSTFTWSLDAGTLELFYPNDGYVRMTRYQNFAEIDEVLVETDNAGIKSSSYLMVAPFGNATLDPLINQFAQNSLSLTNPDAYDNEGNFDLTDVFGYRLQDNGVATRIWSGDGDFNFNDYGSGWDTWQLNWGDLDSAVMTSYLDGAQNGAWHSNCEPSNRDCSEHRKRVWVPIQQVGNRVYVIEYEERNSEAWNYGVDPIWYMAIAPRIQYYEVMDIGLDSDSDGINDTVDNDMDNDGFTNDVDAFVFDANEWLDSDGDLTGDNEDAFPFDASEQYDSDDDGVGDNADDFPYDATQTTGTPVDGISFNDVELQNCVNDIGATFVEDITSLDCSNRNLSDISDISQLASLKDVNLVGNKNISDFSSLALISSLIHVDVFDTNFADSDFSAFAGHSTIERIALNSNLVTSIADAASMPNLRGLHLWTENIYDLSVLTGLANFNELAISVTQVVDFNVFTQLNLEHLWLNGELEPWQVDIILGYSNMQQLSLGWNSYLSNDLLSQFINKNPNLSTLGIESTLITDLSSLFVNGESWNELVIPLKYINVDNLAVLDGIDLGTQVQELMNKGVQVDGELAHGWLIADALANINDAELKQCLIEHTQGMTVTGQLKSLDCDGRNIHDIWGLWVFDNLRTLILNNNPILDLGGELNSMQFLQELHLHNTLVADINTLWNNPELTYVGVNNLPLNDPEQVNDLSANIFVDGVVQATVALSSLTFNDVQLQQCVDDNGAINIRELTDLNCNGYGITDITDIHQLTNLFNLNLSGNSGIVDFSSLTQIASLTVIGLTDLLISDGQMDNISNIMRLEDLDISNNDTLTDLGPLNNARQLRAVHLWGSNSYDLTPLTNLPSLHMVALDNTQLTNELTIFTQMSSLRNLHLNGELSYSDFEYLLSNLILHGLGQSWNSQFDDSFLQLVIANQPDIQSLNIDNTALSNLSGIGALTKLEGFNMHSTLVSDLQPLIDLRNAQDILYQNDDWKPVLQYININVIPLADETQITTLQELGVQVDGEIGTGTPIANLTFTDANFAQCVSEQTQGMLLTGQVSKSLKIS
jgi:hypothetical protein